MAFAIALLCLLLTGVIGIIVFTAYTNKLARRSAQARHAIIENLGISATSKPQFIGYFHPYWYVYPTTDWDALTHEICLAMQVGEVNVSFGLP
jgi:hypothetical protein